MQQPPFVLITGLYEASTAAFLNSLVEQFADEPVFVLEPSPSEDGDDASALTAIEWPESWDIEPVEFEDEQDAVENIVNSLASANESADFSSLLVVAPAYTDTMEITELMYYAAESSQGIERDEFDPIVVCCVNAATLMDNIVSVQEMHELGLGEEDYRDVSLTLAEQIETADVVILCNGESAASKEDRERAAAMIDVLNPRARVISDRLDDVANPKSKKSNEESASLFERLDALRCETSANEEFESDVYDRLQFSSNRPFHPQRLYDFWVEGDLGSTVLRSHGFIWLATRNSAVGMWSQICQVIVLESGGPWWAQTPREEWELSAEEIAEIESIWSEPWGDRHQQLKVIVERTARADVEAGLHACLLTDDEFGTPDSWASYSDPFGSWDDEVEHDCGCGDDDHCGH